MPFGVELGEFHIFHYASKQDYPFRADQGFCEVRFAPMTGHREAYHQVRKANTGHSCEIRFLVQDFICRCNTSHPGPAPADLS
jgi:hypothetical protein